MLVIAASPLTKAFLPDWKDRLMADPDSLFSEDPFTFKIKRSSGALHFEYNKPIHVAQLLPKAQDKDLRVLFDWLTGGDDGMQTQETNIYGIVAYDPGFDPVKELTALTALEGLESDDPAELKKAQKKLMDRQKAVSARMKELKEGVRVKADARVLRHMRMTHNNLIKQWQMNEENKLGKFPPSDTEMFGAHALNKEIDAANQKTAEMKRRMSHLMDNKVI
jgi:hypothetical protein